MVDIRDYLILSKAADSIAHCFSNPADFKAYYGSVYAREKNSLVRHFIVNNSPFAFKDKPILYEQVTQYISDKLQIAPHEVKLIGSAKTGFSISPLPNYGNPFGTHSDLDFSLVNEELFNKMENEFNDWSMQYNIKSIKPNNSTEEKYWNENLTSGTNQLRRGFIDSHFIPNRSAFPLTQTINNSMWLVQKFLNDKHSIKVKKASASIYRDWNSFAGRLNFNTEQVMKSV